MQPEVRRLVNIGRYLVFYELDMLKLDEAVAHSNVVAVVFSRTRCIIVTEEARPDVTRTIDIDTHGRSRSFVCARRSRHSV